MKKGHIDIISLGCSKNLIDSERLIKRLQDRGWNVSHNPDEPSGEYVVVNTCGFIGDAKEESVNMLLGLGELKSEGRIGKIVAMGCLTERYRDELAREIPEIDRIYGKFDWNGFIDELPGRERKPMTRNWDRTVTTPSHSAYLKISEGCNRMCAFCAIPLITGRHKSRGEEEILEEVSELSRRGVKEFNVIAQDLSSYGLDRYGEHRLAHLIDRMADIPGVEWIRLHYAYPTDFPHDLLDVMARRENVCKYIDIALQHCSDNVLGSMRRHIDRKTTESLLDEIRAKVPGIRIRTTLMVGFPGETEEDFNELLEFVKDQKFDRMGAFAYCEEEGTYAALHLEDNVPEDVKQRRLDKLMELQENISDELNSRMVGWQVRLLVDEVDEEGTAICRSEWDSPEVDLTYTVRDSDAQPGDFITAEITASYPFDFEARRIR